MYMYFTDFISFYKAVETISHNIFDSEW